ncbi:hypothetical protein KC727_03025 [Candidatus Kaiserbacteria bacterium]|nr:hypothetical protein [Candidatus Kaiserbacteria bacterium]
MRQLTTTRGFTLLEAIIYIALFMFVIGGGLLSAYQIFEGSASISAAAARETEINFALRKINWALNGTEVSDITKPTAGGTADELIVTKDGHQYTLSVDGGQFVIETGGDSFPLTNLPTGVTAVSFTRTNTNPQTVSAALTVDGETLEPTTHYVRTN